MIDGFETDDLGCFEEGVGVAHVEEVPEDFLVEDVSEVFGFDSGGEFDFEGGSSVI